MPRTVYPRLALLRLPTLLLSVSAILCAAALAAADGHFSWPVLVFSLLCAASLQIAANIANDYGDGIYGTDRLRDPSAPPRMTVSGRLPQQEVRRLLSSASATAAGSGLALLAVAPIETAARAFFLLAGTGALCAALRYTLAWRDVVFVPLRGIYADVRRGYGYHALGEPAVFVCFGLLAVGGGFYLHGGVWPSGEWLPACGSGLLAAAVLHVNNWRDIRSDRAAGKQTPAGWLGFAASRYLLYLLHYGGLLCYAAYAHGRPEVLPWLLFLLPLLPFYHRRIAAARRRNVAALLGWAVGLHAAVNLLLACALVSAAA